MRIWQKLKSFVHNDDPKAQLKWSLYGRVWREIGLPYWRWLVVGAICTIIAAAAEAYSITLVKAIVEEGVIEKNMAVLYMVGLQIVAAFTVKSLFGYAKMLTMTKAGLLGTTRLRRHVYRQMLKQPMPFFHGSKIGKLKQYFTKMINDVFALVTGNVISIVQSVATMSMMFGLMLWFAPQMTLILLFLAPGVLIPLVIITRKRRVLIRAGYDINADSISHINQTILGIKTIQSFGMEDFESQNMELIEDARIKNSFRSAKLSGLQTPLLEIMISIGLCLALIAGGHLIAGGSMATGDFLVFLLALTAIYKPSKTMTGIGGGIQNGLIAAEKLFHFLDRKPELLEFPDAVELQHAPMEVKLDHISFAYNKKDGDVLHDVSLEIRPGTICAFVGPSGGGKSTLFNLIGRFYDPRCGSVLFNGVDIRKFTLESIHRNIATVSQDVFLFSGTIAENIKYGSPEATREQIEAAAVAANAHEFIMEFPDAYDNHVGERGTLLSGGQKQRIAIARAILKDAPVLLLDEATSALDSHSERHIQAALKNLMHGRTTFVIAHRLTTVLDADLICLIKGGRIMERGTDAELYALGGEYKRLKDIQFKDSIIEQK